jgi:hypothetical protein
MLLLDRLFTTDPFTRRKRIATFWVIVLVAVVCCAFMAVLILMLER